MKYIIYDIHSMCDLPSTILQNNDSGLGKQGFKGEFLDKCLPNKMLICNIIMIGGAI